MIPTLLSYRTRFVSFFAASVLAFFIISAHAFATTESQPTVAEDTTLQTQAVADETRDPAIATQDTTATFESAAVAPASIGLASVSDTGDVGGTGDQKQTLTDGGNTQLRISTEGNTGALTYEYPFFVPPARGKVVPALSLTYNSQFTSDLSPFGYGWNLSIPYIERMQKGGIETLYSTTVPAFTSSISGELVQVATTSTKYTARVESASYVYYTFSDGMWVMTDSVGTKYYFGETRNTRIDDGASTSPKTYRWMLERVVDTNGNSTLYTYAKDGGLLYPNEISFAHSSNTPGIYTYRFEKIPVQQYISYQTGFKLVRRYVVSGASLVVDGKVARTYNLRYGAGINGQRQLLLGVTEIGVKDSKEVALPETKFEYGGSAIPSWHYAAAQNFPEPLSSEDVGTRFADLNGDGLTDVVKYYQKIDQDTLPSKQYNTTVRRVHLNKGDGTWDLDVPWDWSDIQVPFTLWHDGVLSSTAATVDFGTKLIDMNGDGRDDLVLGWTCTYGRCSPPNNFPQFQEGVYLNTGSGFAKAEGWDAPDFLQWYQKRDNRGYYSDSAQTLLDVNADGLPDLVYAAYYTSTYMTPSMNVESSIMLNTGSGWKDSSLTFPAALGEQAGSDGVRSPFDTGVRLGDVNGDGLVDVLHGYRESGYSGDNNFARDEAFTFIHTGNGWSMSTSSPEFGAPPNFVIRGIASPNRGYDVVDINADGLVDIVKSYKDNNDSDDNISHLLVNKGTAWEFESHTFPFFLTEGYRGGGTGMAFTDFTGDTVVDVLSLRYDNVSFPVQTSGGDLYKNTSGIPDLLTRITTSYGGTSEIKYDGYLDIAQGTYSSMGKPARNPVIVSSIRYDAQHGDPWTEAYTYTKGAMYFDPASLFDRRFAGFETVTRSTPLGKTTTYFHQGNGVSTTTNETNDSFARIGFPYLTEVTDTQGNLYVRSHVLWNEYASSSGKYFVHMSRELEQDFDGNATSKDKATEYFYNNATGVVWKTVEFGEVRGTATSSFVDVGGDRRTTSYTYTIPSFTRGLVLPVTETVTNQSNLTVRRREYYYDDSTALASASKGNLTQQRENITSNTYVTTKTRYNGVGLPTASIDGRGATTSYTYDVTMMYPKEMINPLGHRTLYAYDLATGQVQKKTDANGFVSQTSFDGLGRPVEISATSDSGIGVVPLVGYVYIDTGSSLGMRADRYSDTGIMGKSYEYKDGFGRTKQMRTKLADSSNYAVVDTVYGVDGVVIEKSLPYQRIGIGVHTPLAPEELRTSVVYDPLKRPQEVHTALGDIKTSYDEWMETVTDAEGKRRDYAYDAYGRLASTTERLGTSRFITKYTWDLNDNLLKITDALGNIRSMQYDFLGRRTRAEDLHKSTARIFGIWKYTYDQNGNILTTTDPQNVVVAYSYDPLNRRLTENVSTTPTIDATWSYDSCENGIGRLCATVNTAVAKEYAYTKSGLVAEERTRLRDANAAYAIRTTYDRHGLPQTITYPDGGVVTYVQNDVGQIERILYSKDAVTKTLIDNVRYGVHGKETRVSYGNGVVTQHIYDQLEQYRLRSIFTVATTTFGTGGPGDALEVLEAALVQESAVQQSPQHVPQLLESTQIDIVPDTRVTQEVIQSELLPIGMVTKKVENLSGTTSAPSVLEATVDNSTVEAMVSIESVATTSSLDIVESARRATSTEFIVPVLDFGTTTEVLGTTTVTTTEETLPHREPEIRNPRITLLLKESDPSLHPQIKAHALSETAVRGMFTIPSEKLRIEIVGIEEISDGVQVFIRAWRGGKQLGFGEDGSVEIERIRIVNPPILVWRGDTLFEDLQEALLETLTEIITTVGKEDAQIEVGKIGKTTTTIYPFEGVGNASTDGRMFEDRYTSWNTTIGTGAARKVGPLDSNSDITSAIGNGNGPSYFANNRLHFGFDTSLITADPTIHAATFLVHAYPSGDTSVGPERRFYLVPHNPISSADMSTEDYGRVGTTSLGVSNGNWMLDQYNEVALNEDGLRYIQRGGTTNLATRTWYDLNAVAPDNDHEISLTVYLADEAGTTRDPMLVIEHQVPSVDIENVSNGSLLQHLTYTYDRVGNITKIVDASDSQTRATTTYIYDDLYRLLSASTTDATSTPYKRTYSYNALGNIITSDQGTSTYAGTNFANPHAPTKIGAITYNYDRNGNLASTTAGLINTWNYRNRLVRTESPSTSPVTYVYDTNDQRVSKTQGSNRTDYIGSLYEVTPEGTTKNIYLGDLLIATIEETGTTTKTRYHHHDHLSSTRVSTNEQGTPTYTTDYYPYGTPRTTIETDTPSRQYIGQIRDEETTWNYLNARYYDSARGQFLSQDPVFWEIGESDEGKRLLQDPQLANSYSYARNNPILHKDPDGRIIPLLAAIGYAALTLYDTYDTATTLVDPNVSTGQKVFSAALFASPLGEVKAGLQGAKEGGQLLYRAMKEVDETPAIGQSATTLGVRPGKDIPVDENGMVHPNTGGMSVSPDSATNITQTLRPESLGGRGKNPAWCINCVDLPQELKYRPDPTNQKHGFIEPSKAMPLDEYQNSITKTQKTWKKN